MKKWLLLAGAVLLSLLVVVTVGLVFFLDAVVKKGVETLGPRVTKTEVVLASASLSPWRGTAHLSGLVVGNPEGFKAPYAMRVGEIAVRLRPGSIFAETIEVDRIEVRAPELTLEGGFKGNNLSRILANVQGHGQGATPAGSGTPTPQPAPAPEPQPAGRKFRVKELSITGGRVTLAIGVAGGKGATFPLPDMTLRNLGGDGQGLDAGQLAKEILQALTGNVVKAAGQALPGVGDAASGVTGQADKALKGIKNLFKP
jgi:uncharacterized protein involved in outer membrane biogenesis